MNMMEAASAAFTVFFTLESLLKIAMSSYRRTTRDWTRLNGRFVLETLLLSDNSRRDRLKVKR